MDQVPSRRLATRGTSAGPFRGSACRPSTPVALVLVALLLAACGGPSGRVAGTIDAVAAPDFPLVAYQGEAALGGRETRFARAFAGGRPVVLNFWAGRCPPCRAEMPAFQRVADEYDGRVLFVGVDVGSFTALGTHQDARALLADLGIRYPAGYAVDATPLKLYGVTSMPSTVFLDGQGRIAERTSGLLTEGQLRAAVAQLVGGE